MNRTLLTLIFPLLCFGLLPATIWAESSNSGVGASQNQPINLLEEKAAISNAQTEIDSEAENDPYKDLYKVELLIFAYVNTGEENSEKWRNLKKPDFSIFKLAENPSLDSDSTSEDSEKTSNKRDFMDTEAENVSDMKSIMRKMAINGHYRTLTHQIWQQKVLSKDALDLFYIEGGESYLTEDQAAQANNEFLLRENTASGLDNEEQTIKTLFGQKELEGTLHIYRSRYLHIVPDLWLTDYSLNSAGTCPVESARVNQHQNGGAANYTALTNYHIDQSRRLKSGELHYIDHPMFGLLIKFTKVAPPELDSGLESGADESFTETPAQ